MRAATPRVTLTPDQQETGRVMPKVAAGSIAGAKTMDDERKVRIDVIAGKLVQEAMTSGLTWEEAIAALSLAAKATAQAAAGAGHAPESECVALARRSFEEAFAQEVNVVVVGDATPERDTEDNPLLATARRRQSSRLH